MNDTLAIFGAIAGAFGAVTGTAALVWRIVDEFGSFLRISLQVEPPKAGWATALTTIENKGIRPKKITYAILLVGPESESPLETAKFLAENMATKTHWKARTPLSVL